MSQDTSVTPPITRATEHTPVSRYARPARAALASPGIDLTHSGVTIPRFISMHVMGAIFPITAGIMLYGWRAISVIVLVVGSAAVAALVWRSIGMRGGRLRLDHVMWLALVLALMLPAHLASTSVDLTSGSRHSPWSILPAAGIALVILIWLLGGAGAGRIHPVLIAHLLLIVLFQDMLAPRFTLRRQHAFAGDLLNASPQRPTAREARANAPTVTKSAAAAPALPEPIEQARPAWISAESTNDQYEAFYTIPAAERLESFTNGHETPERARISLESLVRDRLPPLEDLIVGGQPAPLGQGSAIAVIIGGLFLLYRGLIDFRVPMLIFLSAFVSLLVLRMPIVITETEPISRWLAMNDPSVGTSLAVTFANYEVMASPLLFMGFFLATAPAVRPLARRARVIYAVLVGVATAAFQLYVSVSIGPYLALLGISLLSPTLDRMFRPRALL